jgi:hypothetical protein
MKNQIACFLLGKVEDGRITHVFLSGEPPMALTQRAGDEYVTVLKAFTDSFQESMDLLGKIYPVSMPKLSALFPFPKQ